jgi:hypothetical protein
MKLISRLIQRVFGTKRSKPKRYKAPCVLCGKSITVRLNGKYFKHNCINPTSTMSVSPDVRRLEQLEDGSYVEVATSSSAFTKVSAVTD